MYAADPNTYVGHIKAPIGGYPTETVDHYIDEDGNETTVEKSTSGVYVRIGNEISFKQIEAIYSGEDYVISNVSVKDENIADDTEVLRVYDQIVTEGANLYDGKIIQRSS